MALARRITSWRIATQITALAATSMLLGIAAVIAVTLMLLGLSPPDDSPPFLITRMADVTRFARAARTAAERDAFLAVVRGAGFTVTRRPIAALVPAATSHPPFSTRLALQQLTSLPGIVVLNDLRDPAAAGPQTVVRLDDDQALVFGGIPAASIWPALMAPTLLLLAIVLVTLLLLAAYAARGIAAPLMRMAAAAAAFGRTPHDAAALPRRGPRDILLLVDALNDMRARIRALLDDRTRVLAAISHDLRTPLTRLRLRAERVAPDALRDGMLTDLTRMGHMIDDTLCYLRDDARREPVSRIDLPSVVQTVCSDFTDMGHAVSYVGPARLAWRCRPLALTRAITNVVDNGVKHGRQVTVTLALTADDAVVIAIADDGPGIAAGDRERVLAPFFKAEGARPQDGSGFGLGLSIAQDILRRHGGDISLAAAEPRGLIVRLRLPAAPVLP
ncbi:sensor histidine kinase [Bradyrhizobium sp. 2TAF24]|uniref:sensor histidine kinase n=1 Tax=Bradyrhizobium sp. 2TAF24 TaxID=3233011 RepID=UPI003F906C6A